MNQIELPKANLPVVSVIVPTYNRSHTIGRAINSILKQTYNAHEIIVIDNRSLDDTRNLIKREFPNVVCVEEKKQGVSAARNKGISLISEKSQWIAFLDSDDEWCSQKLELQIAAVSEQEQYRLVHTDEIWYRRGKFVNQMKKHKKSGGDIFKDCLKQCLISPSSVMIRRDLLSEVGMFDEDLLVCEDYDLWLRVTAREPILYINKPLTIKHGGHDDQLSQRYWGMDRFRVQSIEKLVGSAVLTPDQESAARAVAISKIQILINGAIKRGNTEFINFYQSKLEVFQRL